MPSSCPRPHLKGHRSWDIWNPTSIHDQTASRSVNPSASQASLCLNWEEFFHPSLGDTRSLSWMGLLGGPGWGTKGPTAQNAPLNRSLSGCASPPLPHPTPQQGVLGGATLKLELPCGFSSLTCLDVGLTITSLWGLTTLLAIHSRKNSQKHNQTRAVHPKGPGFVISSICFPVCITVSLSPEYPKCN